MNLRRPILLAALLVVANIVMAIWAYLTLPPGGVAITWHDLSGATHRTMPAAIGLSIMPFVALVVTASLWLAPSRSRNPQKLAASATSYGLLITSLAALFLVVEGALIARALDPSFDVIRWVFLAAAVLLVLVGNTLGKVRHNDVFGVRTGVTLADPRVWDKTQRFAGRLMVVGAIFLAALASLGVDHPLLIGVLVLVAAGPYVAGAIYARTLPRDSPSAG